MFEVSERHNLDSHGRDIDRYLVFRAPFRPFTLKMNDGRDFHIRHPELMSVRATPVYLIDDRTDRGVFLEPALITSTQPDEKSHG